MIRDEYALAEWLLAQPGLTLNPDLMAERAAEMAERFDLDLTLALELAGVLENVC